MIKISLRSIFGALVSKENLSLLIGFTPWHLNLYLHLQARYHLYLSPALTLCCLPAQLHEVTTVVLNERQANNLVIDEKC